MELRVLRYFLTVAKEQSFTKAAEQLHITQPTLSRQLAALEEELGTALFNRGGRCITLTAAGLLLKRRALEIMDLEALLPSVAASLRQWKSLRRSVGPLRKNTHWFRLPCIQEPRIPFWK